MDEIMFFKLTSMLIVSMTICGCAAPKYPDILTPPTAENNYNGVVAVKFNERNVESIVDFQCYYFNGLVNGSLNIKNTVENSAKVYSFQCKGNSISVINTNSPQLSNSQVNGNLTADQNNLQWCEKRGVYVSVRILCEFDADNSLNGEPISTPSNAGKLLKDESVQKVEISDGKNSVRYLRERLKQAEAEEAATRRSKLELEKQAALESLRMRKEAAVKEAANRLASKREEEDRQRAAKAAAAQAAAEAKRGDGSKGDLQCKSLNLLPTTPKYLACRKNFDDNEERLRLAEEQAIKAELQAKKAAEDARRAEEVNKLGDGSPEHATCFKFGFILNSPEYSNCRLQLEIAKQQSAERQEAYELERQKYEQQLAEYEAAKARERSMAWFKLSNALLNSKNFSQGLANGASDIMGVPRQPEPPKFQNFTIKRSDGRIVNCTSILNQINCN